MIARLEIQQTMLMMAHFANTKRPCNSEEEAAICAARNLAQQLDRMTDQDLCATLRGNAMRFNYSSPALAAFMEIIADQLVGKPPCTYRKNRNR